jgi:sulfopyruvate decarboxylase subunit alpha
LTTKRLTSERVLAEIKKTGVTHIVWLPETEAKFMYDSMMSQPDIKLVPVCREGEALGIATGLYLGGKKPLVLHQNTGMFESGDSIRAFPIDWNLPMLLMIGYRGFKHEGKITDSAATYTEPILKAWGIKYYTLESDEDAPNISIAYKEAYDTMRPVVVLIMGEFSHDK